MSDYSRAEIESEAAIYAEGTRFTRDDLIYAWNTDRKPGERLQDFFERCLSEHPESNNQVVNEEIIRGAISRSVSHNEIVHCDICNATSDDIHSLVMASQTGEWDFSQENRDEEGHEVLDVYSLDSEDDQWRIKVTIVD
jgi:hypothetical protein